MKEQHTYHPAKEFEKFYIGLRELEGRIYTDEEVSRLPHIDKTNPKYREWKLRACSLSKLTTHVKKKEGHKKILEVGCGNGWLAARLSRIKGVEVVGADINDTELSQAQRVFNDQANLKFIHLNPGAKMAEQMKFDLIVFAASIQYFSPINEIIDPALELLRPDGEIHIIDTHFYTPKEVDSARERTRDYYAKMGYDVLSNYYHHHSLDALEGYNYHLQYDPNSWMNKLTPRKNPFPWIVIQAKSNPQKNGVQTHG